MKAQLRLANQHSVDVKDSPFQHLVQLAVEHCVVLEALIALCAAHKAYCDDRVDENTRNMYTALESLLGGLSLTKPGGFYICAELNVIWVTPSDSSCALM